jgi:molybdenum cofactor cytidylyltransferase
MKFLRTAVPEASGAVLAHTVRLGPSRVLKKGHVLTERDVFALAEAGHETVAVARLEADDVPENVAASELASAVAGDHVRIADAFTGRANLYATARGVAVVSRQAIDSLNAMDESMTVATVAPYTLVEAGDMLATVKVIPFSVRRAVVDGCAAIARDAAPIVRVAALKPHSVGLILTRLQGTPERLLDIASRALAERLEILGSRVEREVRCYHDEESIAAAIRELRDAGCSPILAFGASAVVDRQDVIPRGVELAGGTVDHLGMPVDPGNLLLLAHHGDTPIVGAPGCARSPKPSGFDWVIERLLSGLAVTGADLMRMGAGGLLKEIPMRPQTRQAPGPSAQIAAVILAAGRSERMGSANKLLASIDGVPMIARVVDTVLETRARPVVVVTGHDAAEVRKALGGRLVMFVHNPEHGAGLSTSVRAGLSVLSPDVDAALICLGDTPQVRSSHIGALLSAFDPVEGRSICVPFYEGRRGNPVLWAARYFTELASVEGDVGGRPLLERYAEEICPVAVTDEGVTVDVDTPAELAALVEV